VTTGPVVVQVWPDNPNGARVDAKLTIYRGTNLLYNTLISDTTLDIPAGRFVVQSLYVPTNAYYYLRVSGKWQGTLTAKLTAASAPVMVQQPQDSVASPYGSAAFGALAAGMPRPTYQWLFNGSPLPGQTGALLVVHDLQTNNAGSYSVIATNSGGSVVSAAAWLTVRNTNPVPVVRMLGATNGSRVYFLVQGEPGRHYRSQTTDDLNDWSWGGLPIRQYAQATNKLNLFSINLLNSQQQFVTVSLDGPTDGCVAQLKAYAYAINSYTLEHNVNPLSAYTLTDLAPYFHDGLLPFCPGNGTYSAGVCITNGVSCSLGFPGSGYDGGHHWP